MLFSVAYAAVCAAKKASSCDNCELSTLSNDFPCLYPLIESKVADLLSVAVFCNVWLAASVFAN